MIRRRRRRMGNQDGRGDITRMSEILSWCFGRAAAATGIRSESDFILTRIAASGLDDTVPRPRRRKRVEVEQRLEKILTENRASRYFVTELYQGEEHQYRQATRGRPGPNTRYVRKSRKFWQVRFSLDEAAIGYERNSDGMYPLLTNERSLTDAGVSRRRRRRRSPSWGGAAPAARRGRRCGDRTPRPDRRPCSGHR